MSHSYKKKTKEAMDDERFPESSLFALCFGNNLWKCFEGNERDYCVQNNKTKKECNVMFKKHHYLKLHHHSKEEGPERHAF